MDTYSVSNIVIPLGGRNIQHRSAVIGTRLTDVSVMMEPCSIFFGESVDVAFQLEQVGTCYLRQVRVLLPAHSRPRWAVMSVENDCGKHATDWPVWLSLMNVFGMNCQLFSPLATAVSARGANSRSLKFATSLTIA